MRAQISYLESRQAHCQVWIVGVDPACRVRGIDDQIVWHGTMFGHAGVVIE
jgi:hypothetical protein